MYLERIADWKNLESKSKTMTGLETEKSAKGEEVLDEELDLLDLQVDEKQTKLDGNTQQ